MKPRIKVIEANLYRYRYTKKHTYMSREPVDFVVSSENCAVMAMIGGDELVIMPGTSVLIRNVKEIALRKVDRVNPCRYKLKILKGG